MHALTDEPLAFRPQGRRAVLLLAETGLRASEACELTWEQVQEDVGGNLVQNTVRKELQRIGKHNEVLRGLRPHTLRHWFGTAAMEADMDLLTLQSIMGHASPETTRRYAEPSTKKLREGMQRLSRRRKG